MPQQLPKDRPTAADKKREADLVKALEKEDFYGKKKAAAKSPAPKPIVKVTSVKMKIDRPTAADKKREDDLVKALQKEKFYNKMESPLMRAAKSAKKQ
jgi:hypothetical protein